MYIINGIHYIYLVSKYYYVNLIPLLPPHILGLYVWAVFQHRLWTIKLNNKKKLKINIPDTCYKILTTDTLQNNNFRSATNRNNFNLFIKLSRKKKDMLTTRIKLATSTAWQQPITARQTHVCSAASGISKWI